MTEQQVQILEEQEDDTLARWWSQINQHGWPEQLPPGETKGVMDWIVGRVGESRVRSESDVPIVPSRKRGLTPVGSLRGMTRKEMIVLARILSVLQNLESPESQRRVLKGAMNEINSRQAMPVTSSGQQN